MAVRNACIAIANPSIVATNVGLCLSLAKFCSVNNIKLAGGFEHLAGLIPLDFRTLAV